MVHDPPKFFKKQPTIIYVAEEHWNSACHIISEMDLHDTHWSWGEEPAACQCGGHTHESPADVHFDRGIESYENNRIDEAEKHFLLALEADPASEDILYNLALVYLEQKRYDRVRVVLGEIKEIDTREIQDVLQKAEKGEIR